MDNLLHDGFFPSPATCFLLADIFCDKDSRLVKPAGEAGAGMERFCFAGQQQKDDLGGVLGKRVGMKLAAAGAVDERQVPGEKLRKGGFGTVLNILGEECAVLHGLVLWVILTEGYGQMGREANKDSKIVLTGSADDQLEHVWAGRNDAVHAADMVHPAHIFGQLGPKRVNQNLAAMQ